MATKAFGPFRGDAWIEDSRRAVVGPNDYIVDLGRTDYPELLFDAGYFTKIATTGGDHVDSDDNLGTWEVEGVPLGIGTLIRLKMPTKQWVWRLTGDSRDGYFEARWPD